MNASALDRLCEIAGIAAEYSDIWGWPVWPESYRDPASPQVREYLGSNSERVDFHAWLQWLAEEQLAGCGRPYRELGLGVGLYQDVAAAVDRAKDRARPLMPLQREGLLPAGVTVYPEAAPEMIAQLELAMHVFLARTPARVMMIQTEDVLGQLEQVNLPATTFKYPNRGRKLLFNLRNGPGTRV